MNKLPKCKNIPPPPKPPEDRILKENGYGLKKVPDRITSKYTDGEPRGLVVYNPFKSDLEHERLNRRVKYMQEAEQTGIFEPQNQAEKDWWFRLIKDSEINDTDLHKKYNRYLMYKKYKYKSIDLVPDQAEEELKELKELNDYMKDYE
jgi:hypothetical protein